MDGSLTYGHGGRSSRFAPANRLKTIEKGIARQIKQTVERFAATGAGNVKKLHGFKPPEYRLRAGDYRVRFDLSGETILILRVRNRRDAYR